jgi:hypothetical protein
MYPVVILAFILGGALAANAQPLSDIATDQELHAGYCLGAIQKLDVPSPINTGSPKLDADPKINALQNEMKRLRDDQIARLRDYLAARGLGTGVRSIAANRGLILSIQRGRSDASTCFAHIDRCVAKCSATRPYDSNYISKCTGDCRDQEQACVAIAKCSNLDRLPF